MSEVQKFKRPIIDGMSKPTLARHARMRHDAVRDRWTILAPERVFTPDAIAIAVLQLCDGNRSVADIGRALSQIYSAPEERILADITAMLQDLADKGMVVA
jgi:pyrroloquinoline quinone biosynthesis protein D